MLRGVLVNSYRVCYSINEHAKKKTKKKKTWSSLSTLKGGRHIISYFSLVQIM